MVTHAFVFPTEEVNQIPIERNIGNDDRSTWDKHNRVLYEIREAIHQHLREKGFYDRRWLALGEPFANDGFALNTPVFMVHAYDWAADDGQAPEQYWNFLWRDFAVRWYKYFARCAYVNRELTDEECEIMKNECIAAIKETKYSDYKFVDEARAEANALCNDDGILRDVEEHR